VSFSYPQSAILLPALVGVSSTAMRRTPLNLLTIALLMFQLAIGLQWQVAYAEDVPAEQGTNAVPGEHCKSHAAKAAAREIQGAQTRGPLFSKKAFGKHDCCRSAGCQCHCAQYLATLNLPVAKPHLPSAPLPAFNLRAPATRTDELFRPPIA
jgi:hypothetical protein